MVSVSFDPSFRRAFKRRIAPDQAREKRFRAKLLTFIQDPFHPTLRTHRLSGKLKDYWSFTVEYDLRVIFYFVDEDRAVFIDIGTHREVY